MSSLAEPAAIAARPAPAQGGSAGDVWVIVLAGGSVTRLAELTRDETGLAVPKHFCRFDGRRTLLRVTLERATRLAPAARQVVVVAEEHARRWAPELSHLPPDNVLVQPLPRGTAAGLLLPLLAVLRRDPRARLVVLPSDHHVADEDLLARSLRAATLASRRHGGDPVLLGMHPDGPDSGYGWIVPGPGLEAVRRISAFVEKPDPARAVTLLEQGAVWSTFMLASAGPSLLRCFERALPALLVAFRAGLPLPAGRDGAALRRLYEGLPSRDFSRHVLEACADEARVLRVPWCGWTDLGTPERVAACTGLHGAIVQRARLRAAAGRAGELALA
jgi:mannose-1-phosphate guanylyltransferase